jgi:hypothetical protein
MVYIYSVQYIRVKEYIRKGDAASSVAGLSGCFANTRKKGKTQEGKSTWNVTAQRQKKSPAASRD